MVNANNSPLLERAASSAPGAANLVGVVIVNFFTASYLRRSLVALTEQSHPADTVLVINNGDQPGALDFIAVNHPSVHVLDQDNIGFAAANNLAIARLNNHRWIALLNPDAFPEPAWLEQLLWAAHNYPGVAVFSSQLLRADSTQILDGDGDSYHLSGLAWRHNHGRPARYAGPMREVFSACAAAALYRRDALIDVNGFDSSYFCYFEDIDLGFRLRLRGYRCLQVPSARVHHVGSAASGCEKSSDFALYHGHRNLVWTFVKNMPSYWFWLLLPMHVLLNLVEIIWYSCKGRSRVMFRAKLDALKGMPAVWIRRRQVQALRTAPCLVVLKSMTFWPLMSSRRRPDVIN